MMTTIFKKENRLPMALYSLLIILIMICYYPLITSGVLTDYDDKLIVQPLMNVHSVKEYFHMILDGRILDLQPVRDLSYFHDISLHTYHFTNVFLWILICVFFKKTLTLFGDGSKENNWLIWSLVFLYALSPVYASSVAWIAARKHLLSTLFTLLATYFYLRKHQNIILITIFYVLACLSQPINLLWPLFVLAHSYVTHTLKEKRNLVIVTGTLALTVAAVNFYYYNSVYAAVSGGDGKYDSEFGPGLSLLAMGRYFFISIFPFDSLPVSHYQGSWQNMAGLALLAGFIFWLYKNKVTQSLLLSFGVYFLFPLIPVTYKITRIFCSDTYVLNAALGIYLCAFVLLKKYKKSFIPVALYALVCFSLSLSYAKIFLSTEAIWSYAYAKEPTPMSIQNLADNKLVRGELGEAKALVDQLEVMEPENRFYPKLKSDVIYNDQQKKNAVKIQELLAVKPEVPVIHLRLALLYSNESNKTEFFNHVVKLFGNPQNYIRNSYLRNEEVIALIRVACEKNQLEVECKKHYDEFSRSVRFNNWNADKYKEAYFAYKSQPNELYYR